MNDKLINYISMLEEEIKRIKEKYYSPESVGQKEKYFRDHNYKYRVEIKELKAENERLKAEIEELKREKNGISGTCIKRGAEIIELKDELKQQKHKLLDEIRYGTGI